MTELFTFASGLIGSALLGVAKKTNMLDGKVGKFIKPFQPAVVMGAAVGLPLLANAIGLSEVPSADVFTAAPLTTVLNVTLREVLRRLQGK